LNAEIDPPNPANAKGFEGSIFAACRLFEAPTANAESVPDRDFHSIKGGKTTSICNKMQQKL
jgi:hypothetical protein